MVFCCDGFSSLSRASLGFVLCNNADMWAAWGPPSGTFGGGNVAGACAFDAAGTFMFVLAVQNSVGRI